MVLLSLALFAIIVLTVWQVTRRFNTFNVLSSVIIAIVVIFIFLRQSRLPLPSAAFLEPKPGRIHRLPAWLI